MGRTALYRDMAVRAARAELQLEPDAVQLVMPDGRARRHELDGRTVVRLDGFVARHGQRRFVRMLFIERGSERHAMITPPDQGAVAPTVVRVPEAPAEAAVIDARAWDALAEWLMGGGRLGGCAIADLARLAAIATPQFAIVIGEVCAKRAVELAWVAAGPLRGGGDVELALQPLVEAARYSQRAAEALVSALAHVSGAVRRRTWRTW
jgi:hypothetical protein